MRPIEVIDCVVGGTVKVTLVNSGVTPSGICSALFNRSETLVDSVTATSSGNGFYYALHTPNTPGIYVNKWFSAIGANTYVTPQYLRALAYQAD